MEPYYQRKLNYVPRKVLSGGISEGSSVDRGRSRSSDRKHPIFNTLIRVSEADSETSIPQATPFVQAEG
jgi:hypothetical protein